MSIEKAMVKAVEPDRKRLYRVGGASAVVLGLGYVVTIPLYIYSGAPPSGQAGGEVWLTYLAGRTTVWWVILALSVLTDLLFVPVAFALYRALKSSGRNAMLGSQAFVGLFVVLDLAVTWPNYAALIALSGSYATASSDAQRLAYVGAATYASTVLASPLEAVYSIGVLSFAILLIGLVMRKGVFGKGTAYIGVITGSVGIVSVVGPLFVSALSAAVIIASLLTTVWVLLVGVDLLRLGWR
jgi:hypothetical protein